MHMSTRSLAEFPHPPSYLTRSQPDSIISVSTFSAVLSSPELPRDKIRTKESSAGWFPSFTGLLLFGAALAGIWYGWKVYGRRYFLGSHAGSSGRGGSGFMWSDPKRF